MYTFTIWIAFICFLESVTWSHTLTPTRGKRIWTHHESRIKLDATKTPSTFLENTHDVKLVGALDSDTRLRQRLRLLQYHSTIARQEIVQEKDDEPIHIPDYSRDDFALGSDYITDINQHNSITSDSPSILLEAGAGTGKTTVLAGRIAHLLNNLQVQPHQMIILSFTARDAHALKGKALDILYRNDYDNNKRENMEKKIWSGTIHAFAINVIKKYSPANSSLKIISTRDMRNRIRQCLGRINSSSRERMMLYKTSLDDAGQSIGTLVQHILRCLELWKEAGVLPSPYMKSIVFAEDKKTRDRFDVAKDDFIELAMRLGIPQSAAELALEISGDYQTMHASLGTSDPSDVATIAYEQLIHNPQALHDIRSRLHHVILDEYQDVSVSQHRLLRLIINGIDHSVDTKEIEKSIKFPVLMEESKKKIRIDGPVCYHVPKFFAAGDPNQSIYGWRGAAPSLTVDGFKKDYPQGVIVPLPKNYRLPKNILDAANVLIGESGMDMEYNQETIESDYTLKKNDFHIQVEGAVMKESESSVMIHGLWDLREEAKYIAATIRKRAKARINNYAKVYEQVSKQKPSPQNSLFDSSDIAVMFRSSKEINLFKDALSQHGIPYIVPAERKSLNSKSNGSSQYMKNQRMSSISMKPVKLMTMHHAKGDEFDDVYLANWTEGSFPHPTSVLTNRLQEERRIAYVALTRAKQNVIITYSFMTRDTYFGPNGEKKEVTQQVDASRFLHDLMPDSNEDHLDGVEWNESVGFKEVIAGKDLPPHYAKSFKIPTGYRSQESVSTSINENLSQDNANLSTEYVKLPDNDEDLKKDEVFETLHHGMNMIFNRKRGACKQYKPIFRNMLKDQGISRGRIQVLKREYSSKELKCIHALVNAPSDNIATRPISRCTAKQLGLYLFALLSK